MIPPYGGSNPGAPAKQCGSLHREFRARNMLGQGLRFSDVPFFWSQRYDLPINYVGHADLQIDGDIKSRDCLARYRRDGKVVAVASIFRD